MKSSDENCWKCLYLNKYVFSSSVQHFKSGHFIIKSYRQNHWYTILYKSPHLEYIYGYGLVYVSKGSLKTYYMWSLG